MNWIKATLIWLENSLGSWISKRVWAERTVRFGAPIAVTVAFSAIWIPWEWIVAVSTVSGVASVPLTVLQMVTSGFTYRNPTTEYSRGFSDGLYVWTTIASAEAGADRTQLAHLSAFAANEVAGRRVHPGKASIKSYLKVIAQKVALGFELRVEDLQVNLALPHNGTASSASHLCVVIYSNPDARRGGGKRKLPLDRGGETVGASKAFCKGEPEYVGDTRKHPTVFDAGAKYKSVMSFPLKDHEHNTIGVINIDSPRIWAFGKANDEDRRESVYVMCATTIQRIAVAIIDSIVFEYELKEEAA